MQIEEDVLQALASRIVQVAHPERIIFFGSAARGSMRPDSDLDVLVVVPAGTDRLQTAQRIYRHLIGFSHPVDVVVATGEDLQRFGANTSLVYYPALTEGREIYAA